MSDIAAINTALSGLYAAQDGLDTTGNNIANANTPGYTRQRVDQTAAGGSIVTGTYATNNGIGTGVSITGIERVSDGYLEARSLAGHATTSNLTQTQTILNEAQLGFAEPGANGLSAQLQNFWSAWDNLANNPTDSGVRTALLGSASNLSAALNQAASGVASTRTSASAQAMTDISTINTDLAQVAAMNKTIAGETLNGRAPNDLIDQRNSLVDSLAQLAGVTTQAGANGTVNVFMGGDTLVQGGLAQSLYAPPPSSTTTGNVTLTVGANGPATTAGGTLGALVAAVNTTLPNLLSGPGGLDGVANALAKAVNTAQANGVYWTQTAGSNPPTYSWTAGPPMFTDAGTGSSTVTTAATIGINPSLTASQIAASAPPPAGTTSPTSSGQGDGSNAQIIAELANSTTGPDSVYHSFIGSLGNQVSQLNTQVSVQTQVSLQVDQSKSSVEGVNLDQEMTQMLQYQQAYAASAKYLNAVNQTIQTLLAAVQ